MFNKNSKQIVQDIFDPLDININGSRPWDIQVHNPGFYQRILSGGPLALGESYMDKWWDVEQLDEFIHQLLSARLETRIVTPQQVLTVIKSRIFNMQTLSRSKKVAKEHYDLGNEFYKKMLDKRMQYTCGYWKKAKNLDEAQEHKLDLICRKLQLEKGDRVLELGCGWGGLAKYMAEQYGCHVTAYNISKEQVNYAKELCKSLPVKIICQDYRLAKGTFDKVVSIGLCEHIGYKNHRTLMKVADRCLKSEGLFLLHTIGKDISVSNTDPWINKYIFPNSMLPSVKQISTAAEGYFILEDWHNFGKDYEKTLLAWYKNFNKNWPLFESRYGERFYRMWRFYLLSCVGLFRARRAQLWQIVFSKQGNTQEYASIR